jgi:hypothetical protein
MAPRDAVSTMPIISSSVTHSSTKRLPPPRAISHMNSVLANMMNSKPPALLLCRPSCTKMLRLVRIWSNEKPLEPSTASIANTKMTADVTAPAMIQPLRPPFCTVSQAMMPAITTSVICLA